MGSLFSKELDTLCGVPQGSILCPLISNIDICDLFFIDINYDIANYANDTTTCKCVPYYDKLKKRQNCQFTKYTIFFSIRVFFHKNSQITVLQRKGEDISLTPHYHFHPLYRYLDISRAITAESSPL